MIVTRTPLRIPLGGGGTDLPSYYGRYGGFLVSAAIQMHVYIVVHQRFEDNIIVKYSRTEIVDAVDEVQHPIVREALDILNIGPGLEIASIADVPANTGLGSSASFTVGLLHALHTFKRESVSPQQLAEEAFHIERERLGEPVGKQDQYAAAFGGILSLEIGHDGTTKAEPLPITRELRESLENEILLFDTGIKRSASTILGDQVQAVTQSEMQVTEALHEIKAIGHQVKLALTNGDLSRFGDLLHQHWLAKKRISPKMSSDNMDHWYELARQNGALGGKVMGAGGGGFFMFYCNGGDKARLRRVLASEGLRDARCAIDHEGSKLLVNFEEGSRHRH